jgi:septal ring factor EnvC (AmiA/AmiB activator)
MEYQAASEALGELEDTRELLKAEQTALSVMKAEHSALRAEHAASTSKCAMLERELQVLREQVRG